MNNQSFDKKYMPKLTRVLFLIVASLSLALPHASAQEQFKRDLEQVQFVPKGQWITGVSVSYEQSNNKNYQFFIFENITGDTYLFKVSPMLLYSFHDNVAAGGKFRYQRSRTRIDKGSLILDSETHFDADNLYMITSDYFGTAAFRNYISLGDNRRFGFFNEVQLELGGGQSKLSDHSGEDLTGTFERNYTLNVGGEHRRAGIRLYAYQSRNRPGENRQTECQACQLQNQSVFGVIRSGILSLRLKKL